MPVFPEWEVLGMGRKRKKKAINRTRIVWDWTESSGEGAWIAILP